MERIATRLTAIAWVASTIVAAGAWSSRFASPGESGSATTGACAITGCIFVGLGVLFAVTAVLDRGTS